MGADDRSRAWIPFGILGAIILGVALVPLRSITPASNLAFVFIAFTIVVAEFGGRTAALVAALVSAMSLNFFLTEPYLTLTMSKTDDVVAFFAMAMCGLIAAAFGTRRERSSRAATRARDDLAALQRVVAHLHTGRPLDAVLDELRAAFGLGRLVLRGADDRVLASSPDGTERAPKAGTELNAETLFAAGEARYQFGLRGLRLPEGGGRLRLPSERGDLCLDLWEGDPGGLDQDARRTLVIAASVIALTVSGRRHPSLPG
jgi:two-component system sensor histidine kinase KdpD